MNTGFGSNNYGQMLPRWLAACLLLSGAALLRGQTPDQPVRLEPLRAVAGEAKHFDWPRGLARMESVISVRSLPELVYQMRIDPMANGNVQFRVTVPPTTPPGDYEVTVTGRAEGGRGIAAVLPVHVDAVTVAMSTMGRAPVILLNGFQLLCTDTGSAVADSVNNCAYGDVTIEQLAG